MNSKQRDVLPFALSGAVRRSRWLGPRWLGVVIVFLLGCGAGALFHPWSPLADRSGFALPVIVVRTPAGLGGMRDALAGRPLGALLFAIALGLSAAGLWLLFARLAALARRARLGERLAARLAQALPAEESLGSAVSGAGGSQLPIPASADRRLDQLLSGYRSAIALTARVAELERELDLARARVGAGAGAEARPSPPSPSSSEPALFPTTETDLAPVRQLAEASFLIGSNALVRVRGAIRLVQECRQRPGVRDAAGPGAGPQSGTAPRTGVNGGGSWGNGGGVSGGGVAFHGASENRGAPLGEVFVALAAEVNELSRSARGLRPALEALLVGSPGGLGVGGRRNGSLAPHGSGWKSSSSGNVSILKCRALSVELEGGLRRLGAEVQLLSRSRRPLGSGGDSSEVQSETDRGLAHGLRRLELQLEEVATHLASLTRNAEHLSRELDRPPARS